MRNSIKELGLGTTGIFAGKVSRTGIRSVRDNHNNEKLFTTVCIENPRQVFASADAQGNLKVSFGHILADHIWIVLDKHLNAHNGYHKGDVLTFKGYVYCYNRGYEGANQRVRKAHPASMDYSINYTATVK